MHVSKRKKAVILICTMHLGEIIKKLKDKLEMIQFCNETNYEMETVDKLLE